MATAAAARGAGPKEFTFLWEGRDKGGKVIRGELWEKQANALPACVDCHQPHKVRKVF